MARDRIMLEPAEMQELTKTDAIQHGVGAGSPTGADHPAGGGRAHAGSDWRNGRRHARDCQSLVSALHQVAPVRAVVRAGTRAQDRSAGWSKGKAGMSASTEGVAKYLANHAKEL